MVHVETETRAGPIRPTAERMRHNMVTVPEREKDNPQERPARVEDGTWLKRYALMKAKNKKTGQIELVVPEHLMKAANKFADDAARYWPLQRTISRYDVHIEGGGTQSVDEERAAAQAAAGLRLDKAIAALGPIHAPVIIAVCAYDESANDWAKAAGRPAHYGFVMFVTGLEILAAHYGIKSQ